MNYILAVLGLFGNIVLLFCFFVSGIVLTFLVYMLRIAEFFGKRIFDYSLRIIFKIISDLTIIERKIMGRF